ncbi:hypothetical protein [Chelativorans sp. M5D2P16]|uniref:hypothetical protein n=1 Tax=Chelativorans sp. M5D2P16 TaxID=3095678 RepID=UPI002ACB0406|nr:hypothetical protein [Chelativorans sp. M5D2P16]MDZ5697465.1 hypothetical protein [Chelativorans sp. M5D2P16]
MTARDHIASDMIATHYYMSKKGAHVSFRVPTALALPALIAALAAAPVQAHSIEGTAATQPAAFDIHQADITAEGNDLVFSMQLKAAPGSAVPEAAGQLRGAPVWSYVWPTSFDSGVVGFEPEAGILAFAVTAHPDFDDTPLFDEDGDGDLGNDGRRWHSHWVVLVEDDACGGGALKVKDIPEGETPRLPKTWPNLPILIDSPGWHPQFTEDSLSVRVPFDPETDLKGVKFDAVTAALQVNANIHAPLLCVTDVFEAAGSLGLPGTID